MSRPLHFGDYGGLPLKIIWALLDFAAIVVLASGVYLWLGRCKSPRITTRAQDRPPVAATSGIRP
ncbi:putative iron-regulated membrane protein [Bradyrhizobium liaoningense]